MTRSSIDLISDLKATAEQVKDMSLTLGIRPAENLFSRDIIAARDEA